MQTLSKPSPTLLLGHAAQRLALASRAALRRLAELSNRSSLISLVSSSTLTLTETALLLRSYPNNPEEAAAARSARACPTPAQPVQPAEAVPELPLGASSEAAFGAAVDRAFDQLERGGG